MTMHMLPSYYTTTNSKKRRKQKKTAAILAEEVKTAKLLQKLGYQKDSNYRHEIPDYKVSKSTIETSDYVGNGFKRASKQYTGNEIAGIGTLHKSNMVPVRKDSNAAKEIATMRRN